MSNKLIAVISILGLGIVMIASVTTTAYAATAAPIIGNATKNTLYALNNKTDLAVNLYGNEDKRTQLMQQDGNVVGCMNMLLNKQGLSTCDNIISDDISLHTFDNLNVVFGVDQHKIKHMVEEYAQQQGLLNNTNLNAPLNITDNSSSDGNSTGTLPTK
jgi:hypothetical protein